MNMTWAAAIQAGRRRGGVRHLSLSGIELGVEDEYPEVGKRGGRYKVVNGKKVYAPKGAGGSGKKAVAAPKGGKKAAAPAGKKPEAEPIGMQKLRAMKTKLGFPPAERSVADKVLPRVSAQDLAEVMDMLVRRDPRQAAGSVLGDKIDPKDVDAVNALKRVTGGGSVQEAARELGRAITAMEARAKAQGHSLWGRSSAKHVKHESSLMNQLEAHWRARFGGKVAGEAADGLLRVMRML